MITPIEISVNAANPAMPLPPLVAFLGSPSSLRLVGVPRAVGSWRITAIAVSITYPDGSIVSKAATSASCKAGASPAFVATFDGCAKPGTVTGGYTVTADGIDERGDAVTGYVLGVGDVVVLDRDGTVTIGETTYYLHLLAAKPDSPKRGDVYVDGSGALILFDGTAWVPFAPRVDLTPYAKKGDLDAHVANTNNPHAVTAAQVGALPATKKTDGQYEVSPNVIFLSGLKIESRKAEVRLPVMFGVVDNETEGVTTFKITIPPVGGFKIDFSNGTAHTFLEPDGSDVLTKNVADALYPSKTEVGEKVKSFESVGGASATVENGVANLSEFFTESNSLLNGRLAYSRNATGLKDRAFNTLSFDGTEFNLSTALEEVTPTASGQPRDLLIVATATAATTISYTAGTIKGDKPTIDGPGTWLITLTEYASGVWYCRQIKMEDAA